MQKLTIEMLKAMNPNEIFAFGSFMDDGNICYMLTGKKLHWVAVRGHTYDWCIYALDSQSLEQVATNGDKIYSESIIRSLVPCTDEAFKMYRY